MLVFLNWKRIEVYSRVNTVDKRSSDHQESGSLLSYCVASMLVMIDAYWAHCMHEPAKASNTPSSVQHHPTIPKLRVDVTFQICVKTIGAIDFKIAFIHAKCKQITTSRTKMEYHFYCWYCTIAFSRLTFFWMWTLWFSLFSILVANASKMVSLVILHNSNELIAFHLSAFH